MPINQYGDLSPAEWDMVAAGLQGYRRKPWQREAPLPPGRLSPDKLKWYDENPQAAYLALLPEFTTPALKDYYKNGFSEIYGKWQREGALNQAGEPYRLNVNAPFYNWLFNYDWTDEYNKLTDQEKGVNNQRFAPPVMWR